MGASECWFQIEQISTLGLPKDEMHTNVLRVVISSPSDVNVERDNVDAAVVNLNLVLRSSNVPYYFVTSRWERDAIPGMHPLGPQGRIDEALNIPECDFLVCIFWTRFGTPVAASGSGTEHEIRQAIGAWSKKQSPQVFLYFNESPFTPETSEEEAQFQKLKEFERELLSTPNPPLIKRYRDEAQFQGLVFHDLLASALRLSQSAAMNRAPLRFEFSAEPLLVRSEGFSELVGDIFVKCTYAVDGPASSLPLWTSFVLYLNTTITSRLSAGPAAPGLRDDPVRGWKAGVTEISYGSVYDKSLHSIELISKTCNPARPVHLGSRTFVATPFP